MVVSFFCAFVFKQKTAYEMRSSDWSSDVCSSDLIISAVSALASLGGSVSDSPQVDAGAAALSQNLGQVTAQVLEQTVDLAPIVTVAAGSRIQIIPTGNGACRARCWKYG